MTQTATALSPGRLKAVPNLQDDLSLSPGQRKLLMVVTVLLLFSSPLWLWSLFFAGNYEFGASLLLVPVLCFINVAAIFRVTERRPALRKVMLISFVMKVASAGGYMALIFVYYVKGADASTYFSVGKQWAAFFAAHGSYPIAGHIWGTSFINLLAAILIGIFGPAFPAISVLFAIAAFWGIYFFYATLQKAFPQGRKELGALLLFLLPSCQFWDAALGKDALMLLSIGLASYGFSELISGQTIKGFSLLVPAMALGASTRPHVIGMIAIGMLLPYVTSKSGQGAMSGLAKILGIPIVLGGVIYLVRNATKMLNVDSAVGGLERIEKFSAGTLHGGSSFGGGQSTAVKLILSPFLMFRPFPWEIPNLLGVAAALEALLLLVLLWRVRRELSTTLRHWRSYPFYTFTLAYGLIFSVVFTLALSNFGILVRQRTQLTPLLLILIASVWPRPRVRT